MVLCFFIASLKLVSVVFPSVAGLWFEVDVLIQMYREFQAFKKINLWERRWGFQIKHCFVLGRGSAQSLIRHAGEGLVLLFISVPLASSWVLIPFGFWCWHLSLIMQIIKVWAKLQSHCHFFPMYLGVQTEKGRWLCCDVSPFFNGLNCVGLWTDNTFHHKLVLKIIFKVLILLSYPFAWVVLCGANCFSCFEMLSQLSRNLYCFLSS